MSSAVRRLALNTALVVSSATAILVAPNSPCANSCGNVLDATTGADITCDESQYGSGAGVVFESCTNCELGSTYSGQGRTDLQSLLYNLRYAFSWCTFGDPGNTHAGNNPCLTSTACGPLKDSFEWDNFTTAAGAYDYCADWIEIQVPKCSACLVAGDQHYLNNYLTMLDAACQQKPAVGATISVDGTPFSTVPMNITTPSVAPSYTAIVGNSGPISLGGKVGIAVGGFVLLLFLLGCFIVWNGKRRRRAFLRRLEMRQKQAAAPSPQNPHHPGGGGGWLRNPGLFDPRGGADVHDTPLSQKPLRSWDDSPVSATSDAPRYFSPYVSLQNSPVSAVDYPNMAWPQSFPPAPAAAFSEKHPYQQHQYQPGAGGGGFPTSAQEKMMQDLLEHQQQMQQVQQVQQVQAQQAPPRQQREIGIALGGDAPGVGLQASSSSSLDERAKGKQLDTYESHEVESARSSGDGMPAATRAPVLQHPGYGRNSPPRSSQDG